MTLGRACQSFSGSAREASFWAGLERGESVVKRRCAPAFSHLEIDSVERLRTLGYLGR